MESQVKSSQCKMSSLMEALTNTIIGYFISLFSQMMIFPMYGVHISIETNITIGLWFTVISIARSYTLRRVFNKSND